MKNSVDLSFNWYDSVVWKKSAVKIGRAHV